MIVEIEINLKCSIVINRINLCPRYGVGSFNFASLISGITKTFSTESELEQVCIFYKYTIYTITF